MIFSYLFTSVLIDLLMGNRPLIDMINKKATYTHMATADRNGIVKQDPRNRLVAWRYGERSLVRPISRRIVWISQHNAYDIRQYR